MKYVKMPGLAVIAATALMAFVGGSTASATVLCKTVPTGGATGTTGTTCPNGWAYGAGTGFLMAFEPTAPVPKALITTDFLTIECEESAVGGVTNNEGSATETVAIAVSLLTFEKCNCEVAVLKKGTLEIHWVTDSKNGTLTSSGAEVTALCDVPLIGKVHCIYATNATDLGTLTGGGPATSDIESAAIPRLSTSGFCDTAASWDAHYKVFTEPMYMAAHT